MLPETIAIVLWGTDNLKTEGGPMAQAMALMGARPRLDAYNRVCGAELIPLDELKRPRIDAVMTLSGHLPRPVAAAGFDAGRSLLPRGSGR
jgi:magnesium chelatase subunit H